MKVVVAVLLNLWHKSQGLVYLQVEFKVVSLYLQ